jgi:hypothetical protein
MGLLDDVKNVVSQYASGSGSAEDVTAQFHQLVGSAEPSALSQGISAALSSRQAPPFAQTVSQLFASGSVDQKAGMLNALLGAATPDMRAKLAAMIPGAAAGGPITGTQAASLSSDVVQSVAQQMQQHNPGVIDQMGSFYSQHPALVKTLGTAAMMVAMRKLAERST